MVTVVLLKVALTWATATVTFLRAFRRLLTLVDTIPSLKFLSKLLSHLWQPWQLPQLNSSLIRGGNLFVQVDTSSTIPTNSETKAYALQFQVEDTIEDYRKSLTPFLPATVLRGPLRVRAFVLVL